VRAYLFEISRTFPLPGGQAHGDVLRFETGRRGRPEHEIIAAAETFRADALILSARPRTGPTEPGPRSIGHMARFVVDHAPVPVLLVRRSA